MMRTAYLAIAAVSVTMWCSAQQPVAPTREPVGPARGDDWSGYNFVNSFETGYRLLSVSGNLNKYRSDENFGNGVRLLDSFFSMNSKTGHGRWFDELVVTTNGLGGDPYESAVLRIDKNRLYQYDLSWRRNDYFNPGLTTGGGQGQHLLDSSYTLQDHNLTLFPQSRIRFTLGYSRDAQSGAGISTVQLFNATGPFDATGDIFPIFTNVKRLQNDYRFGGELHWLGFTLNAMHGWEDFKDDTRYRLNGAGAGDNAGNPTFLNSFGRSEPYHGTSPYWRVGLFRDSRWINVNGRFTYTDGIRAFAVNEAAIGTNQFGAVANQQILTSGNARRPVATGNLNLTILPASRLIIASRTSVYNVRTQGDSSYLQYDNATKSADLLFFQYLGIRTIGTDFDARYEVNKHLDVHGGYAYSDRRIAASPQFAFTGTISSIPFRQVNVLNSGLFGLRYKPTKELTVVLDGEVGRANRPFTPRSERNYTLLSGRVQYKIKNLQLTALTNSNYNANSVTLSSFSSHARTYSASASWSPRLWFGLDATYSKLHVDSLGGIAFFANAQDFPNQVSYYVSNLHSGTLATHFNIKRASLYLGYSHVQDLGDGRSSPTATIVGPSLTSFTTAQTFPLRFESPSARVSVNITERIRWNVGYQYFGYHEQFFNRENYLAHTGYTSLLWSF